MIKALQRLLEWFAQGGLPSMMTHAGLSLVVFSGMDILVEEFLDQAVNGFSGLPSGVASLMLLSGVGEFISIIGSALLTRVALMTAIDSVGLAYKGKGGGGA